MARKPAKQIGALWGHENATVGKFMTGKLDLGGLGEIPIAVFRNDRKEKGSKQPDYRIVLSANGSEQEPEAGGEERRERGRRPAKTKPPSSDDRPPY